MSKDIEKTNDITEKPVMETQDKSNQIINEDISKFVANENMTDMQDEKTKKGKAKPKKFFRNLISVIADQTITVLLTFITFYIVKFVLMLLGYEISDAFGVYLYAFIATNILYLTIVKSTAGKTMGEKIFNRE